MPAIPAILAIAADSFDHLAKSKNYLAVYTQFLLLTQAPSKHTPFRSRSPPPLVAASHHNIGVVYRKKGDLENALLPTHFSLLNKMLGSNVSIRPKCLARCQGVLKLVFALASSCLSFSLAAGVKYLLPA